MLWNRLIQGAALCGCLLAWMADAGVGQVLEPEKSPPPTFFTPPGRHADGAIVMPPPMRPGKVPDVIWRQGDGPMEAIRPSDHWVGLQCGLVSPALRAQLGLEEEQGVLVEEVVQESPGAKAGIQRFDVLVQAGDRKLTKVQDLVDEVDKVKNAPLAIELIRKGEKVAVEVTPEKRPPIAAPGDESAEDSEGEWSNFFDYMQHWKPGQDGRPSMKLRFWRQPGTILPSRPKPVETLPGNVKIQIRKQGDAPAEIEVTRGDETWSVNEDELDQLPADLRPHVERWLGAPHGPARRWEAPSEPLKLPNALENMIEKRFDEMNRRLDQLPNPLGKDGVIEKRFEEMNRRLDQMRDSLNELRGKSEEAPQVEPKVEEELEPEAAPEPEAPEPKASAGQV